MLGETEAAVGEKAAGEACVEQTAGEFEEQRRERELRQLTRRASKLGLTLTPAAPVTALSAA